MEKERAKSSETKHAYSGVSRDPPAKREILAGIILGEGCEIYILGLGGIRDYSIESSAVISN